MGQPGAAVLAKWMLEAELERFNGGAVFGLLIVKRAGTTDVGKWWAYMPMDDVLTLTGATLELDAEDMAPVCMSVESAIVLLRAAGYGDPLGELEHFGSAQQPNRAGKAPRGRSEPLSAVPSPDMRKGPR
jgi:hypothetical protein